MKAYLDGKAIQYRVKYINDDVWDDEQYPSWNWYSVDYRIKPDESKKLMTCRQLAELMTKGYGEFRYKHNFFVKTHFKYDINNENKTKDDVLIRAFGSDEWIEPTVDVYEEYISKWNRAFKEIEIKVVLPKKEEEDAIKDYSDAGHSGVEPSLGERFRYKGELYECIEGDDCDRCSFIGDPCYYFQCSCRKRKDGKGVVFVDVSKEENTTATEESSSTVSKEESIGVHRRTPQEIADFFNCGVAYDPSMFRFVAYEKPPVFSDEIGWIEGSYNSSFELDRFAITVDSYEEEYYILYRPHLIPIIKEKEDRPSRAALAMGTVGVAQEADDD